MKRSPILSVIFILLFSACGKDEVLPAPYSPPVCCGDHPSGIEDLGGVSGMNLQIPEVFTPNGDGSNDFLLVMSNAIFTSFDLIVQRQDTAGVGTTVYHTSDLDNFWVGARNLGIKDPGTGSILPADNYLVLVSGTLNTGESFSDSLRVCLAKNCDDNIDGKTCLFPDQLGSSSGTLDKVCD